MEGNEEGGERTKGDNRGVQKGRMQNGELSGGWSSGGRWQDPVPEATEATEADEGDQVCRFRSIKMIRSHPITSDQIKPNPTKRTVQPGSRLRPLDQNWRGRTSISVERVGCGEMLNG